MGDKLERCVEKPAYEFFDWAKKTGAYAVIDNSFARQIRCPSILCEESIWRSEDETMPYDPVSKCWRCPRCGIKLS